MHHGLTGDLQGHFYFGAAYIFWASWWIMALARRGGASVTTPLDGKADAALASLPAATGPFEMWGKVLVPLLGIGGELRWVEFPITDSTVIIYQHITAYAAVSVSGMADLLTARRLLPPGSDRLALAQGFLTPGFLFALHGHQLALSETAHRLLAGLLIVVGLLVLAELVRPSPLVRWARIYLVLLAGTWLFQVGWMLYAAGYDLASEAVVGRAHTFFVWHAVGVAAALLGFLGVLGRRRRAA